MKRIILAILAALLCLNLTSCKSKEEQKLERIQKAAEEARKAAEQADWEYEKVKRDFDAYDRAMERLNGK